MPANITWQPAFVAGTVALGGTPEDARASLGAAAALEARELLGHLEQPDRARRAHALATVIAAVAADVEIWRLA